MKAVNLIPPQQHGTSVPVGRSGGAVYAVFALIGGLAILISLYGIAEHDISSRNAKIASLSARTTQAQQRASELAPYTSFVALREQRTEAVNQLVSSRFDWANAVYELGRVLPHGASITSLQGTVGSSSGSSSSSSSSSSASSGSVASATPPGSIPSLSLAACASSQAEVAFALKRLHLMAGVHEVLLQNSLKAAKGGGASSGGAGCGGNAAVFNVQVVYEPMPSVSTAGASPASTTSTVAPAASFLIVLIEHHRSSGREQRGGASKLDLRRFVGGSPMTTRDRIVVLVVITLAVLAGGWLFVVSPKRDKAAKLDSQVSAAETQLTSAESQLNAASAAQAKYQQAYASLVRLGKAVPASQEVPSLIYQLAQASERKNVEFSSVTTSATGSGSGASSSSPASASAAATGGFSAMPFTFVFTGDFTDLYHMFQQLNEFAVQTSKGNLRVSGRLLTIQGVQLAPGTSATSSSGPSSQLTGTVTATAYVLPTGQTVTGGATPSGPAGTPTPTSSTSSTPSTPAPAAVLKGAP